MWKPLTLAISLVLTISVNADTDCNVKLREGELNRLEMPQSVEREIINPDKTTEKKQMPAKADFQYAVLTVKLAAGKSVSLYDYALQVEGSKSQFNIIAMSIDGGVFQRTTWEARANGPSLISWVGLVEDNSDKQHLQGRENVDADTVVKLIFEVPAGSKRFNLISRLLSKNLVKEYGVSEVLDFDDMSKPTASTSKEEEEEPPAPKE